MKTPGENNLTQIFQLLENRETYLKSLIEDAYNTFIFEVIISISSSGMTPSIQEGVTYAVIDDAIDRGLHVVAMMEIPSVAGASLSGVYAAPFMKKLSTGELCFSVIAHTVTQCILIHPDNTITYSNYAIEDSNNKVSGVTTYTPDHVHFPTTKAVYDFVGGKQIVYSSTAPTVDNRSVVTIVV